MGVFSILIFIFSVSYSLMLIFAYSLILLFSYAHIRLFSYELENKLVLSNKGG